ncbi:MAG: glycosyltransferase family 2 protein [candidate division WOR-3 bacterium]|nr:MAG: glycosyltransferase family 2 protein [candidate division WOR-3 bacterium]
MKNSPRVKLGADAKPLLSVIIVSYQVREFLRNCLDSIFKDPPNFSLEVIVVDNASTDGTSTMLKDFSSKTKIIINDKNVGFSRANNIGIEASRGEFVLLLNPDTVMLPGALDKMLNFMQSHPNIGAMGCRLVDKNGNTQSSCGRHPTPRLVLPHLFGLCKRIPRLKSFYMSDWNHSSNLMVDWVCAACFLTRRRVINEVGLLDECLFLYGEEMDWCTRMSMHKWKTAYYSEASVIHYGGESIMQTTSTQGKERIDYARLYVSLYRYFSKFYGRATTNTLKFLITILVFLNLFAIMFSPFLRPRNYATRLMKATGLIRVAFMNMHLLRY